MTTISTVRPGQGLCGAFRAAASMIYRDMARGRTVDLVPWETSLTDYLLLNLVTAHPHEILARRFDQRQEGEVGADWEWWFRDTTGYAGIRVQAKRRNPGRRVYGLKQRVARSRELQAERFRDRAAARGLTALYCLYGDTQPRNPSHAALAGACAHGPPDPTQWGCSMLLAADALRYADKRRISHEEVLDDARPLFHLVCDKTRRPASFPHGALTDTVNAVLADLTGISYDRRRQTDQAPADDLDQIDQAAVSSHRPPGDVVRAFDERDAALVQPTRTMAGVVLLDAR